MRGLSRTSQLTNRRDPSGTLAQSTPRSLGHPSPRYQQPRWVPSGKQATSHHLLDDNDIVYTTLQSPPRTATLAPLPSSPVASALAEMGMAETGLGGNDGSLTERPRFEFRRRGTACGDVGWGCNMVNPHETTPNGRIDGHALVSSDLTKKHQFMRLSGDSGFDKRAGRLVAPMGGSLRKPQSITIK